MLCWQRFYDEGLSIVQGNRCLKEYHTGQTMPPMYNPTCESYKSQTHNEIVCSLV